MGQVIAASGPTRTRLTRRADAMRTWVLSACKEGRRSDSSGNEDEETGSM